MAAWIRLKLALILFGLASSATLWGGCARFGFSPAADRGDGSRPSADGASARADGASATDGQAARDGLRAGTCLPWPAEPEFGAIQRLDQLSSPARDIEPFVTPDGLTIYLSSSRHGGAGGFDVYRATRPSRATRFGTPVALASINSKANDTRFAVSRDRLSAYLASKRGGTGSKGGSDLWVVTRTSVDKPFVAAGLRPLSLLNSSADEWDPFPTADGLSLYYEMVGFAGGSDGWIVVSTRSSSNAPWKAPVAAAGLNAPGGDGNASLTDDELIVVFTSLRAGTKGGADIYFSRRGSKNERWATPQRLAPLNSPYIDNEPFVTGDGCAVYFGSDRPGGKGGEDIYRALLKR